VTHDSNGAPRVYIVLVNWNGADDTIECLDSLFDLDYPNFRVVVCDNASTDGSVERITRWAAGEERFSRPAESPLAGPAPHGSSRPTGGIVALDRAGAERGHGDDRPLTLIRTGGNLGFAGGNNVALRWILARGDAQYVWLLNNDTVTDRAALSALVEELENNESIGAAGSRILFFDEPDVVQAAGGGNIVPWTGLAPLIGRGSQDGKRWEQSFDLTCILGASLFLRISVLSSVGLLDERYFLYSEEMDLCHRISVSGHRMRYVPSSRVWHKESRSVGWKSTRQDYHFARSVLLYVRKFHPRLLPLTLLHAVYRFVLPKLIRWQPDRLRAVLRGLRDGLRGQIGTRIAGPGAGDT
jgi:GT2 family glycosyltransferase